MKKKFKGLLIFAPVFITLFYHLTSLMWVEWENVKKRLRCVAFLSLLIFLILMSTWISFVATLIYYALMHWHLSVGMVITQTFLIHFILLTVLILSLRHVKNKIDFPETKKQFRKIKKILNLFDYFR